MVAYFYCIRISIYDNIANVVNNVNNKFENLMIKCTLCDRTFKSERSMLSHRNHHDPVYKEKSKNGALSSQQKASAAGNKKKQETANNKYQGYKCTKCGNILPYENAKENRSRNKSSNMFCSKSCAASFNNAKRNRPKTSKTSKTRIYVQQTPEQKAIVKQRKLSRKIHLICSECGIEFVHHSKIHTCSDECKNKRLSKSLKESHATGVHKGNQYRSRSNRSYMERSFEEWLISNHPHITFEIEKSFVIRNDNDEYLKTYYVDFYFPDLNIGIELDGTHHLKQVEYDKKRDADILNKYGVIIYRIGHKEYVRKTKIEFVNSLLK